jgi:O-antigen/teichoic acid export membrane protein
LTGLVASYVIHPYRPRWCTASIGALVDFSKWLLLDNAIAFARGKSTDFMLGKLVGAAPLGLFNLARETASVPQASIAAPINRAILPGYARLQDDLGVLRTSYLAVTGMTTMIGVPMALGIAGVASLVIPLFLGEAWHASAPLIELLGFATAISLCGAGAPMVYLAVGRPRLVVVAGLVDVGVLLSLLALLVPTYGTTGAAWAMLIAAAVNLPVRLAMVRYGVGRILGPWIKAVWRPLVSAAVMYLVVDAIVAALPRGASTTAQCVELLVAMGAGLGCFVGLDLALWWLGSDRGGAERVALRALAGLFRGAPGMRGSGVV